MAEEFVWKGRHYTIANLTSDEVTLVSDGQMVRLTRAALDLCVQRGELTQVSVATTKGCDNEVHALLRNASPSDLEVATKRYRFLEDPRACKAAGVGPRTVRQWRKAFRQAEQKFGYGFVGLLPGMKNRGNREPRFPRRHYELADEVIQREYCNAKQQTRWSVYGVFGLECERQGLTAPKPSK